MAFTGEPSHPGALYTGTREMTVQINGRKTESLAFDLTVTSLVRGATLLAWKIAKQSVAAVILCETNERRGHADQRS